MNLKSPTFTGESYQELLERRPRVWRQDQTLDPDSVLQETKLHQGESLKIEWEDAGKTWVKLWKHIYHGSSGGTFISDYISKVFVLEDYYMHLF